MAARITVFGRPGCHLCDDAEAVVAAVAEEAGVGWEKRNILDDPEWTRRYHDFVPVVLVDGRMVGYWHVDPEAVWAALRS